MAIELISTVKPKNNGTFPIVEANDIKGGYYSVETIEIRDSIPEGRRMPGMLCYVYGDKIYKLADDLITWEEFKTGSIEDPSATPNGIWIGVSPPPNDNTDYVLWIDTSDQSLDESFSSLVIDEFKNILTSLTNRVIKLEEDVAYLKEFGGGGGGGNVPIIPPDKPNPPETTTYDVLMTFEDGSLLTFEDGSIMTFSKNNTPAPITNDVLMTFEDGSIMTFEDGAIMTFSQNSGEPTPTPPTTDTNDILMTFENGSIMTFEGGELMCFSRERVIPTTNYVIMTDEHGNILTFEDGSIMTFEQSSRII